MGSEWGPQPPIGAKAIAIWLVVALIIIGLAMWLG